LNADFAYWWVIIACRFTAVAGYGLYRILKAFSGYSPGDTISARELANLPARTIISTSKTPDTKPHAIYDYCDRCGEVTERFSPIHCQERHCKRCHARDFCGEEGCYCGNCFYCYGHAGGNECNVCSSD